MTHTDAPHDPETRQFVRVWVEVQQDTDDDADTGLPAVLALGAGILLLPLGFLALGWVVLMGVSR